MVKNSRVYAQYADKPKAVAWYGITPTIAEEVSIAYEAVRTSYDIDTAKGEQLDVIGRIVVIDRSFESQVLFEVDTLFGGDNEACQFGAFDGQFEPAGGKIEDDVSDAIYRILIRAKIAKNNGDATLDGIVDGLSFITSSNDILVIDNEDMTFSVSFGFELTDVERFVFTTFDVLQRPQGVQFLGYIEEPSVTRFGGPLCWGDTRATFGFYFGA